MVKIIEDVENSKWAIALLKESKSLKRKTKKEWEDYLEQIEPPRLLSQKLIKEALKSR